MEPSTFFAIISIILVVVIVVIIKLIEYTKFKTLKGSYKATGVIFIIIGISEIMYLSISFKLLTPAIEVVTSLSALLLFFTFLYLNKLQNAISGMSIAVGTRMNVGDTIEFNGLSGEIMQIGLTKTIVKLTESEKILFIPNKRFDEAEYVISKSTKQQN